MKLTCSRSIESPNVRMDSAGYQANIFNYCEETGKTFAIGGQLDELTLKAIEAIPESGWKHHADCATAETTHSMNGIKELKISFGVERMSCGQFEANATFFRIGVIAHNLLVLFKHSALGGNWQRHQMTAYAGDYSIY